MGASDTSTSSTLYDRKHFQYHITFYQNIDFHPPTQQKPSLYPKLHEFMLPPALKGGRYYVDADFLLRTQNLLRHPICKRSNLYNQFQCIFEMKWRSIFVGTISINYSLFSFYYTFSAKHITGNTLITNCYKDLVCRTSPYLILLISFSSSLTCQLLKADAT